MNTLRFPRGLYGITPDWPDFQRLLRAIESACEAGLPILQWRRKHTPFEIACEQAQRVARICQITGTTFIINDDWQLALEVQADGVHLGKEDASLTYVQSNITSKKRPLLIGTSCYNDISIAQRSIEQSADYIAFGAIFTSPVKPEAVRAPLTLFKQAYALCNTTPRPTLVGIGGITLHNAPAVIQAGADSIAVISGLFEQNDIYQTTQDFIQLFTHYNHD